MILKNTKINMPQSLIFMKLPNLDTADIKCFTVILHNRSKAHNVQKNIYILGVFTEKPYSKLLECNRVYISVRILSHVTSMISK